MTEPAGPRFANALTDVLLSRDDVQDVIFDGTRPTTLRLTSGQVIPGPPLELADGQLADVLRRMAGSGRSDPSGGSWAGGQGS
jgi:hypothetical protein